MRAEVIAQDRIGAGCVLTRISMHDQFEAMCELLHTRERISNPSTRLPGSPIAQVPRHLGGFVNRPFCDGHHIGEAVVRDTCPKYAGNPPATPKGRLVVMAMITSALRDTALESRARREAKRVDLVATKSRGRKHTTDDHGGFQLVDPRRHAVVIGSKYNLSAKDVIEFCTKHVGND
jgi:hypothetical protein